MKNFGLILLLFLNTISAFCQFGRVSQAIVNGTATSDPPFNAVVFLTGGCTGTFVHPNFILTAAHCIPLCSSSITNGCLVGSNKRVSYDGDDWVGRNGPVSITAFDGTTVDGSVGGGNSYVVDFVYFTQNTFYDRPAPDIAILRTTTPFTGAIIPIMPFQDLPTPDNLLDRYEFTWPYLLGYSTNNISSGQGTRRIGRSEVENDIQKNGRVFVVDGHGRAETGSRTCRGDSGGPVIWDDGFGGYLIGGVISGGKSDNFPFDNNCPAERGESYIAFVSKNFLNDVATRDNLCGSATNWNECSGNVGYGAYDLAFLDIKVDQCSQNRLRFRPGNISLSRGNTVGFEVPSNELIWDCGRSNTDDKTEAPNGTNYIIARRSLTASTINLNCYSVISRNIQSVNPLSTSILEDGSSFNPYKSISKAVSNATEGNFISLSSARYNENLSISKRVTIVSNDDIAIIGSN